MNKDEYSKLSKELLELSNTIPLNWGNIQNDITDAKINLFKIRNKNQLENKIKPLSNTDKNYYRRRWFLWQCARVDEYLFYSQNNILKNPNTRDKEWDIEFDNNKNLRFDVKGTIVPKKLRANFTFSDEEKIINYYYQNQSKGIRNHIQNRLFIVHHSFYDNKRCLFLRCQWDLKLKAYQHFIKLLQNEINYVSYKNVIAKCIFIFESKNNEFSFKII